MGLCKEMFSLKAPIEEIIQKMESASLEITATQTSRQREVWRIVENKVRISHDNNYMFIAVEKSWD